MASTWLDVRLLQSEPTDMGLDTNGRARFTMNLIVTKTPSRVFDAEIVSVLVGAGIPSGSIFVSSKAQVPTGDGPYAIITMTGGPEGIRTHNVTAGSTYLRSTAQVMGIAATKPAALLIVQQAAEALEAVKNTAVA
jgi:hypothetical protein